MFRNVRLIFRNCEVKFSTNIRKCNQTRSEFVPSDDTESKLLKVAVIGVPNAGKSTFINNLMDRKVCATSSKVHTTRKKSMAIFTEGDSQIVFLDTPGLVNFKEHRKFNLERTFMKDSKSSMKEADVIGVMHDSGNFWTRDKLDIKVIKLLEEHKEKPSFLVLNKVDMLKSKRKLLDITRLLTENCIDGKPIQGGKIIRHEDKDTRGWPHFQDIFMVSALTGNGLPEVKEYLLKRAKPGKWLFSETIWSNETAEEIITNSVKAKLLDFLPQEIPYELRPELEFFNVNAAGVISTVVIVHCPSERLAKLVAGVSDGKLRQINESLQRDLQDTFQNYVRIKVVLEVDKE